MDKFELLALMMREDSQAKEANLYSVTADMAEKLANIAGRLDQNELACFVEIGATIYRQGVRTFGAGVPMEDLFPARESAALAGALEF